MEFAADDAQLANGAGQASAATASASTSAPPPAAGTSASVAESVAPASDAGADAGSEAPVNPRKRKKASRACDFCHVNHQPCDNGKPKCSVCQKHNKPCLYLRPTKRRGPQKGYRTALNTYKESAAAWGAVLGAIPGLDALIEGHLRGSTGKYVISSIKDTAQQEALINRWQESSVFKAFFGHNNPTSSVQGDNGAPSQDPEAEDDDYPNADENTPIRPAPFKRPGLLQSPTHKTQGSRITPISDSKSVVSEGSVLQGDLASLSDLVAKDAAQSSSRASQTLASLGFAPNETIADFYTMGSNPEPIAQPNEQDFDPELGSESEQRAYYELLMGRSFPG
ncbi:hypothetical protein QBC34DRAFT_62003 [Podospora aff. communis PSN243]|uniref:Zn(2)-C6 fungal-type domain-containing protein n=1 Tax=Podospora aff. communis PSN243 TaxID=3040156 RepID=A0AAV9GRH4_9PEZI|nr:hypothetical protein QBC34DRAFT_62003 [Podospora aff. communis PSN243]